MGRCFEHGEMLLFQEINLRAFEVQLNRKYIKNNIFLRVGLNWRFIGFPENKIGFDFDYISKLNSRIFFSQETRHVQRHIKDRTGKNFFIMISDDEKAFFPIAWKQKKICIFKRSTDFFFLRSNLLTTELLFVFVAFQQDEQQLLYYMLALMIIIIMMLNSWNFFCRSTARSLL